MKSNGSIEIEAPIEQVFDAATNQIPEWSSVIVEDEVLHETPEGVGSTFRCITEDRGNRMEFAGLVTGHEPPTRTAVTLTGKQFDIEIECRLEDLGGRTRYTQFSTVRGKGLFKLILLLAGPFTKRANCEAFEKEQASLKAYCEARVAGA